MRHRLLFLSCLLALAPIVRAADDDFRVTGASGDAAVWAADAKAPSPARVGLPLSAGDRLVTGRSGHIEMAAKNGTVFQLQGNSAFSIGESSDRWSSFRLRLGRLLAKFAPSPNRPYRVNTPVAVASIRGTELVLDVGDTGALKGGVVEGEVAFEPATESDAPPEASSKPAADVTAPWSAEKVSTSGGIEIAPNEKPKRLADIPRALRPSLAAFPSLRERVPRLRDSWKELAPSEREELRRTAFRDRIKWEIPARVRDHLSSPKATIAPVDVPAAPPVQRLTPPRPDVPARPRREIRH